MTTKNVNKKYINKILCIVQARTSSTRLPNKVLMTVNNTSLLKYEINRIKQAKKINKIVVATTTEKKDDKIIELCKKINIDCFRGSENDVLDRYYQCSLRYPRFNNIMRLTGDCPLIDPGVIDKLIIFFLKHNYDYASNVKLNEETYPQGMDCEVFTKETLTKVWQKSKLQSEREHVTLYIRNRDGFKKGYTSTKKKISHYRLTIDNPEDFEVIKFLIENSKPDAGYLDYIKLLNAHPEIAQKNMHIKRHEGMIKSLKNDYEI